MRDTAGHLSQHPQLLLPQHRLLRLAQVLVSDLQGAVKLRLVSGNGDMLAQLPEEFAFTAAKAVRRVSRDDENAEYLAFHHQRGRDHGLQSGSRQALRKGEWHLPQVGLVHELSAHATRQAIRVDRNTGLFSQPDIDCQLVTLDAY